MFDNENRCYQTSSRRQKEAFWAVQHAPKYLPYTSLQERAGCCHSLSKLDLQFLPDKPSFGASQANSNTKGRVILKRGLQMLNRNSNTKSIPALTSLPRFFFSLSVFPPNFPYWQPEHKSSPTICPSLTLTSTLS